MLAISLSELHYQGGVEYMTPLTIMLICNVGILLYLTWSIIKSSDFPSRWLEVVRQIGLLALAWGTWSTLVGFFQALDYLESATNVVPFPVICGGLKVALITVLYGLIIFCLSYIGFILIRLFAYMRIKN